MELKSFSEGITTGSEVLENQESNVEISAVSPEKSEGLKAFSDDISTGIDIYREKRGGGWLGEKKTTAIINEIVEKHKSQYPGSLSAFKKNLEEAGHRWSGYFIQDTLEDWFGKKYNLLKQTNKVTEQQFLRESFPEFNSDKVLGTAPPKRLSPAEMKKEEETAWKIIRGEVPKYAGVAGIRKWYMSLKDDVMGEFDKNDVSNLWPLMMPDEYDTIKEWEDKHVIPQLGGKANIDRIKELWHMFNPTVYPRAALEMSPQYLTAKDKVIGEVDEQARIVHALVYLAGLKWVDAYNMLKKVPDTVESMKKLQKDIMKKYPDLDLKEAKQVAQKLKDGILQERFSARIS